MSLRIWHNINWCYLKDSIQKSFGPYMMTWVIRGWRKPWNFSVKGSIGLPWLQMLLTGFPNAAVVRWPKGITPRPKIGHLESNNPMDLLCLDFTKIDPPRTSKRNVLIMTDTFSKFSVAVVTPNQQALTVAKVLVDKWFHVYGVPSHIHSDQGKSFDNDIIRSLCKMYGVEQSLTCPYNPRAMPNVRDSIKLYSTYYAPCQKNKRPIGLSIYVVCLHGHLCCHGDLRLLTSSDGASP